MGAGIVAAGMLGPSRGDSWGVWGRVVTREGRPAELLYDATGFLFNFEVGGSTELFFIMEAIEERVDGLAVDSAACS